MDHELGGGEAKKNSGILLWVATSSFIPQKEKKKVCVADVTPRRNQREGISTQWSSTGDPCAVVLPTISFRTEPKSKQEEVPEKKKI